MTIRNSYPLGDDTYLIIEQPDPYDMTRPFDVGGYSWRREGWIKCCTKSTKALTDKGLTKEVRPIFYAFASDDCEPQYEVLINEYIEPSRQAELWKKAEEYQAQSNYWQTAVSRMSIDNFRSSYSANYYPAPYSVSDTYFQN